MRPQASPSTGPSAFSAEACRDPRNPELRVPRRSDPGSAEFAADILLGQLLLRRVEDLSGRAGLDEVAGAAALRNVDGEERRDVGDAARLLHVMGDEGDG